MRFKPGTPKPPNSGRKKGTPNKVLALSVASKLESLGYDPVEDMVLRALDAKTPVELVVKIDAELSQYLYPKRKAIEHSGVIDTNINVAQPIEALRLRIIELIERRGAGDVLQLPEPRRNGTD